MTPIEKARIITAMYPAMMKAYGGFKMDGVLYVRDPVLKDVRSADDLKAEAKAEKKRKQAESTEAKKKQINLMEGL